ncbi:MAG: TetR/AcrR family transcriptional regulator [Saprospiraceae bacterium]|nr:TetR/AcrR family transcriptional regulator [Saprospiraceae bacterium]
MINQTDNIETEEKVLEAARDIFQEKGFSGARMDDIAKAAGVNKALLHYYYRSKANLFDRVFKEAFSQFFEKVMGVLSGDLPLDVKIYKIVDMYSNMLLHNKHLPLFVLSEIRENSELLIEMIKDKRSDTISNLENQLQEGYENGRIVKISAPEFFINLVSLTVFPFLAMPLLNGIFEQNEEDFERMINQRRKSIPKMIIEMLRP